MNSDVKSSREAKSLIHCLRFDRGATPQTSYKKKTELKMTQGTEWLLGKTLILAA